MSLLREIISLFRTGLIAPPKIETLWDMCDGNDTLKLQLWTEPAFGFTHHSLRWEWNDQLVSYIGTIAHEKDYAQPHGWPVFPEDRAQLVLRVLDENGVWVVWVHPRHFSREVFNRVSALLEKHHKSINTVLQTNAEKPMFSISLHRYGSAGNAPNLHSIIYGDYDALPQRLWTRMPQQDNRQRTLEITPEGAALFQEREGSYPPSGRTLGQLDETAHTLHISQWEEYDSITSDLENYIDAQGQCFTDVFAIERNADG